MLKLTNHLQLWARLGNFVMWLKPFLEATLHTYFLPKTVLMLSSFNGASKSFIHSFLNFTKL